MESTAKSKFRRHVGQKRQPQNESDLDRRSLLLGSLSALILAPITFWATKSLETDPFKADVLASILTLIQIITFSVLINTLSQRQNAAAYNKKNRNIINQQKSFLSHFFAGMSSYVYGQASTNTASPRTRRQRKQNLDSSYCSFAGSDDGTHEQKQAKIDPKYFKPKFIIHELMTFWDTTCTVITWGSFYVIGGTIVATEKFAQKIKTTKRGGQTNNLRDTASSSNSQSRFDSFTSSFGASTPPNSSKNRQESNNNGGNPLNKISTYAKRSFTSVKKKINKMTTGTSGVGAMPQLEQPRSGLLNTSFLSGSFRSN